MERLATVDRLVVQQRKEWGEILTGFETKKQVRGLRPGRKLTVFRCRGGRLDVAATVPEGTPPVHGNGR